MAINPKFKLLNSNADAETSIRLFLYYKKKRLVYGTGKSILPHLWNDKKQRPTTNKELIKKAKRSNPSIETDLENITNRLNSVSKAVKKYLGYLEQQGIFPTNELLKEHLDREVKNKVAPQFDQNDLGAFIEKFVDGIEDGDILTPNGKRYAPGTIKNYKGFKTQFNNFQKIRRKKLTFQDVTIDFYHDFTAFFGKKNYQPNTIGRHIKNLKVIMRYALDEGLHQNHEFERKAFKTIRVDTDSIYLNDAELNRLAELDLANEPHMEAVRDVFLVGCYTAQRYSDYSRINSNHIYELKNGVKVIRLIQKKTGEKVVIPVSAKLDVILSKYDYKVPKTHAQKVNDRIKKLGKRAKITELVGVTELVKGKKIFKDVPKYELIMTHTARRSGATNMYLADIPTLDIMKITGHKTERQLLKYIKVTKDQTATRLAMHPFFKRETALKVAK